MTYGLKEYQVRISSDCYFTIATNMDEDVFTSYIKEWRDMTVIYSPSSLKDFIESKGQLVFPSITSGERFIRKVRAQSTKKAKRSSPAVQPSVMA